MRELSSPPIPIDLMSFSLDSCSSIGSAESSLFVWNLNSRKLSSGLNGHFHQICTLAFSSDDSKLVTGSRDHSVRIWRLADGKEIMKIDGNSDVTSIALSADGSKLIKAETAGGLECWDLASKRRNWRGEHGGSGNIAVALMTDGVDLISVDETGETRRWNTNSGRDTLQTHGREYPEPPPAIAAGGEFWACGRSPVSIWEAGLRARVSCLIGSADSIKKMTFSPDGALLATAGSDGIARVWEVLSGREVLQFPSGAQEIFCVAFSPDGRYLGTGTGDGTIILWRLRDRKEVHRYAGHRGALYSMCFSHDGRKLASAGEDTSVLIWSVEDRSPQRGGLPPLTDDGRHTLWKALRGSDAQAAYHAVQRLAADGQDSVAFMKEKLSVAKVLPDRVKRKLLADLASDQYEVRRAASAVLLKHADSMIDFLVIEKANLNLEARAQIERIIEECQRLDATPDKRQWLRAVQVLERIGSPDAVKLLETLSRGPPGHVARFAGCSVRRLKEASKR